MFPVASAKVKSHQDIPFAYGTFCFFKEAKFINFEISSINGLNWVKHEHYWCKVTSCEDLYKSENTF